MRPLGFLVGTATFRLSDVREPLSLTIIDLLQRKGAQVSYHASYFPFFGKGRKYDLQMKCAELNSLV
jgi:UDP-N-acetyl-D-glucosamine dehydrogenase